MKRLGFLVLLAVLFVSNYAFAQIPICFCDNRELPSGLTGNEIVEILCPGGKLDEGSFFEITPEVVAIESENLGYSAEFNPKGGGGCEIREEGTTTGGDLSDQLVLDCRESLIIRCGLNRTPIPTLSEWGLIAMAGVLGVIGLYVAARRRKAAA